MFGFFSKREPSRREEIAMAEPPLHVAALMGRFEIAKLLLSEGAKVGVRNKKGESSIDAVSGEWSDGVAGFYRFLNGLTSNKVDLQEIRKARPRMLKLLKDGPNPKFPL